MCLTLESSQNFAASPLSTTMAFGVTQVPSVHKVVVSKRPERKGGSRGLVSGKELFKNTSKFKFAASPRSPSLFLPPFRMIIVENKPLRASLVSYEWPS